jgi:hypothetical protein
MLDDIETRTLSRSALRHRPIAPDAIHTQVQIRRASRAQQKPQPYAPDDLAFESPPPTHVPKHRPNASRGWLISIVLGVLIAMLLLWLGQLLFNAVLTLSDDLHYGRPRTTHIDHFVGHEAGSTATHFVTTNLNGQVYIIEMPGGTTTSRLLVGPHLIGEGADLAVVSLSFPGDPQHPDLLVAVNGIQVKFHNTGTAFEPAVDVK